MPAVHMFINSTHMVRALLCWRRGTVLNLAGMATVCRCKYHIKASVHSLSDSTTSSYRSDSYQIVVRAFNSCDGLRPLYYMFDEHHSPLAISCASVRWCTHALRTPSTTRAAEPSQKFVCVLAVIDPSCRYTLLMSYFISSSVVATRGSHNWLGMRGAYKLPAPHASSGQQCV